MNVPPISTPMWNTGTSRQTHPIDRSIGCVDHNPGAVSSSTSTSCLLSDGVTFVALLKLKQDGGHPLRDLPAYAEMVESLKQWYDGPPAAERMTVTGSYGLF